MKRIVLLSLLLFPIFLFAQYPTFSNKQRLGVQTTGDGLIYRGDLEIPNYQPSNINNAYFYLDTVRNTLKFYKGGWIQIYPTPQFDTTLLNVYLKISDTTAMLLPYFRDADTAQLNLINRFALKLNISDTSVMLSPYLRKADTISLSNRINLKLNISDTTILSNRITTNANNIITINTKLNTKLDTIYKKLKNVVTRVLNKDTLDLGGSLTEGYGINIIGDSINIDTTIIFTQSDTITLSNRINNKLNISDTVSLSNRIDLKLNKTDTINLSNRIDLKLNPTDTISLSNRINIKLNPSDTVSLSNRINTKLNTSDTISLSNRINKKLDTLYVNYQTNVDLLSNKDTINITTLEAGAGINIVNNVISLDTVLLDSVVRVQNVYVKNGTGTVLNKGEAVYVTGANGTNIIVGRASNVAESSSSKTLGLTITSIGVNGFGYVIKEGLLAGLNTNSATEGDPIWLGENGGLLFGLADKPFAPKHLVYLGVVTRKQTNNGEVYVTVQNGFEIKELHDVRITSPVDKASLYYNSSESLWRDTTATLLVSDTLNMLLPYLRKADTSLLNLTNRFDSKLNLSDTANMLANYNTRINLKLNISDTTNMLSSYLRKADTSNLSYVNTYGNQNNINGNKTFNNVITIDSATVTGKLLVNTNISDAVKINTNTNSTNLELMNSGGSVFIKSGNKNMTLQTDTTALVYLKGDVNKVGILTMNPQQALQVAGTIRVDSLSNNLIPTKLVGGSNSNDLTNVALGTGLSFINDTLKIADNIINSGDTATLLRKDYLGITTNKLVWTEGNKKLLPYFTQVYRNGQLLKLDDQYIFSGINNDTITLQTGSFRLKDNITIIAIDNIVALAGSGGVITLQGNVSGSGTNTINTTINNGVVTNTMLAGGISNDKLDVISTAGKVNNSATTATNLNTVNAIVSRNASGDFTAGTITASLNGNANTSTTLATGRTISITGDLTYTSPSFNGSTNITAVGTLANSGVTANTYNSATITVDSKGRITSATSNTIPTVNDATLTLAVSGNGLTGSQSFTANQSSPATFTVTSNATNANTSSTIVFRDASGNFSANNISANNFLGNATSSTNSTFAANVTNYLVSTESFKFRSNTNALGSRIITFPDGDFSVARTDAAQTFTGTQTFSSTINGSINGNAATATNVAYSGLTGTVPTWNQNTTGNAATATLASTVTTNANLNGDITSIGNTTTIASGVIVNADINASAAIAVSKLAVSTISGVTLGNNLNTLTINAPLTGTSYNGSSAVSIGIPAATSSVNGYLTSTDWTTFNNKQNALSNASSSVSGILTSTDWNTFNNKQSQLNGTGFIKASGTSISYDNSTYLTTSSAASTYLPLTGGTITNDLSVNGTSTLKFTNIYGKTTYTPFNVNIGEQSISNVGAYLRGGTVMMFPDSNLAGSSANLFLANSNVLGVEFSAFGSGIRNYSKQGGDNKRNSLAIYTSDIGQQNTNRLYINYNGDIGINDDTPSYKLDVNGTLGVIGAATFSNQVNLGYSSSNLFTGSGIITDAGNITGIKLYDGGLGSMTIFNKSSSPSFGHIIFSTGNSGGLPSERMRVTYEGNVNISNNVEVGGTITVTNTSVNPTSLLGKNGSNVVGTVTTVAQTGLMTRGVTTYTTGSSVATFDVTHNLGIEPVVVIVTPNAINGNTKIFYEIIAKDSNLFRVQAFNVADGSPATSKTISVYWMAIK